MISFVTVNKRYGNQSALNDVSLQFDSGRIYGLLGPNGSGKSTILKMIAGLVKPDSGVITLNGEQVNRRIATKVSYLTELDFFYHPFTARQMIEFHASQFKDFNKEKASEMLRFLNLNDDKTVKSMSKGNRGRLKLVLALSREAPIVLLDEPFSGLDPMVRESIVKGLLSFIDFEKQTVILSTHEIEEIETLLDEVIVIHSGTIAGRKNVEMLREEDGKSVLEWLKGFFQEEKGA
ncbi:ABC transporter ATP-binding protein [Bacillus sp. M6-12]|nr:ABC transporter ATP-binding protein [Bacillus sp. M6-12]PLS15664.1 ABC transporter ATP-binding protein [Bacillus sp. M6-12]